MSGAVAKPGDPSVIGPSVPSWKGRRHGPRQNRRWSKAWSPEQIAGRLPIDFPDDDSMRIGAGKLKGCLGLGGLCRAPRGVKSCQSTGSGRRPSRRWA